MKFKKEQVVGYNPSAFSPNNIIPALINSGSTVLDVGCGPGLLAKTLRNQGKLIVCDGVDINRKFLKQASKYYRNLHSLDLDFDFKFNKRKYDYIVFADVLEHLKSPDRVLKKFKINLKRSGRIIISLPNIARIENRLKLFLGEFEYQDCGILHQDHLRFFTKKTGMELINEVGLEVLDILPTGLGGAIRIFPTLISFQFIFVCKKKR